MAHPPHRGTYQEGIGQAVAVSPAQTVVVYRDSGIAAELIGGGLVAFVVFVLAVVWDVLRFRREREVREHAAARALMEEVEANRKRAENNQNLLNHEAQDLLPRNQSLVNPLDPLDRGAWDYARLNLPREIAADSDALSWMRDYARRVDQINEMIRSRETFKLQTALASPIPLAVRHFAQLLLQFQGELLDEIDAIPSTLERFAVGNPRD